MKTNFLSSTLIQHLGLRVLLNYHSMGILVLVTCLSRDCEIAYDAFIPHFAAIVAQNEDIGKILHDHNSAGAEPRLCTPSGSFTLETGGFPPLCFTALNCRDRALRHRAIKTLGKIEHTEGPANGHILSQVAREVYKLEDPEGLADALRE